MRHANRTTKLGREKNQRHALIRSLARSLIERGRITTTTVKAKTLRPVIERLVTHARRDTVASRRLVTARLGAGRAVTKLFTDVAPRYATRPGGYTRIVKLAPRRSDNSSMALIEFV